MDIEKARELLAKEGLSLVKLLKEYTDASVYLCKRRNGTKIEAAILKNGRVIIAPE